MKKTKFKPIFVEDAQPCMSCGSVQCALCGQKVKSALEGLKKELWDRRNDGYMIDDVFNHWFPIFHEEQG
jgi:hypothetical protein